MGTWIFSILIFFIIINIWLGYRKRKKWERWPTVDEYIQQYNPSKNRGISCAKCGSHQIWETGFNNERQSRLRVHYCKQCKTGLYRTKN